MGNKKGYIVLEVGFEYNDEIYHTGNNGETYEAPKKVFTDKKKAEKELHKKNMEHLRGQELCRYGYGIEDICKKGHEDELNRICKSLEFDIDEGDCIPDEATDEQLKAIMDCLNLEFFTMVEVDLD